MTTKQVRLLEDFYFEAMNERRVEKIFELLRELSRSRQFFSCSRLRIFRRSAAYIERDPAAGVRAIFEIAIERAKPHVSGNQGDRRRHFRRRTACGRGTRRPQPDREQNWCRVAARFYAGHFPQVIGICQAAIDHAQTTGRKLDRGEKLCACAAIELKTVTSPLRPRTEVAS